MHEDVADPPVPYTPPGQKVHDTTLLAVEYLPAAQAVQVDAPVVLAEPVYEPALHAPHVYPGQAVHPVLVAPPVEYVLTGQGPEHEDVDDPPVPYTPPGQSVHDATLLAVEYLPAAQAVHVVAPVAVPVSVMEPAAHAVHDVPSLSAYFPALH